MADLLSKDMLADLIINIINILILFFVTKKLLYKPVKKYLDKRKEAQDTLLREAEAINAQAKSDAEKYAELLLDADKIKAATAKAAEKEASLKAQSIISEAEKLSESIKAESLKKAEKEKEKMLADAKKQLGEMAVELSEKIIGREVSDEDNRRIIDSFFGE